MWGRECAGKRGHQDESPGVPRNSEGQNSARGPIPKCLTGHLAMNFPTSMMRSLWEFLDREVTHFFVVVLLLLNVLCVITITLKNTHVQEARL